MARDLKGATKHLTAKTPGRKAIDNRKRNQYSVRLPIELVDEVDELIAQRENKVKFPNRADFITKALEMYLESDRTILGKEGDNLERATYIVRLPIELVDEVDELIAQKENKTKYPTRSEFVVEATEKYLANYKEA